MDSVSSDPRHAGSSKPRAVELHALTDPLCRFSNIPSELDRVRMPRTPSAFDNVHGSRNFTSDKALQQLGSHAEAVQNLQPSASILPTADDWKGHTH